MMMTMAHILTATNTCLRYLSAVDLEWYLAVTVAVMHVRLASHRWLARQPSQRPGRTVRFRQSSPRAPNGAEDLMSGKAALLIAALLGVGSGAILGAREAKADGGPKYVCLHHPADPQVCAPTWMHTCWCNPTKLE